MPSAMSVNMLRCRETTESQPRSKNGHPPQRTTGVASASCSQAPRTAVQEARSVHGQHLRRHEREERQGEGGRDPEPPGHVLRAPDSLLRLAPWPCAAPAPCRRWGRCPGPCCTTSGCMGQVYSAAMAASGTGGAGAAAAGAAGGREVLLRILAKPPRAAGRAEVVRLPVVRDGGRRLVRVDRHAAHRVGDLHQRPCLKTSSRSSS